MLGSRAAAAALIFLSAAGLEGGCGQAPAGKPNLGSRSGLYGTVKRGPLRPICGRGMGCYGAAKRVELDFVSGGGTVARVRTTSKGTYRAGLRPGRYTVRSTLGIGGIKPTSVHVPEGKFVRLNLVIDTGIR